ncbi:C40 family peptidase [Pseudonocardia sp. TRM90224]|uniref:C40 family peptidase n=1 Tax=Pseudonocardia sp. TRM90224 TaxID=2812678 RepID=UPI0027E00BAE|nr:C40 family peptidase [Pseudonocardia sp. TRM90224]
MPKHTPLASRAAVFATSTAAAALFVVMPVAPATTPTATATPATSAALAVTPAAQAVPVAPAAAPTAPITRVEPVSVTVKAAVASAAPTATSSSALKNAMSKIGAPYVWGATGPNSFDCSGLVSWAYKQVGKPLPRTSKAQSQVGTPVSKANLRPGDLVFFYKPVSHVAIYIGDGKVVHASTSGSPVKISDMNRMPFNSARRV